MMTSQQQSSSPSNKGAEVIEISPELVRQVADKVYAMLLRDLRLEQERQRRPACRPWSR